MSRPTSGRTGVSSHLPTSASASSSQASRSRMNPFSGGPSTPPPRSLDPRSMFIEEESVLATPAPIKARLKVMERQNEVLHKERGVVERRHRSEMSALKITIMELESALAGRVEMCEGLEGKLKEKEGLLGDWKKGEVEKLKAEMELTKQRSTIDLAQERLSIVRLEKQLLSSSTSILESKHAISVLQASNDDLTSTVKSKESENKDLKTERNRLAKSFATTRDRIEKVESELTAERRKNEKLEKTIKNLQEQLTSQSQEMDNLLSHQGKGGDAEKELRTVKVELRNVKSKLEGKSDDLKELEEEIAQVKKDAREKEKMLKRELRDVGGSSDRINALEDEISALKEANDIIRTKAKEYREQARAARAGNGNGNGNDKHEKEKPVRKTKDVVPDADEVPKATGSGLKPPRQGKRAVTPMSDDAEVVIKKRKATDTELKTVTELPTKHARQIPVTYAEDSDSDSAIRPAPKARSKYDSVDVPRKPFSAKSNISPESDDLPPMKGKAELKAKNAIFAKPKDKEMAKEKDNKKRLGAVDEDVEDAVEEEKGKKKKRKLGNLMKGATFTWDQSKNPEGPIPSYLSPVKGGNAAPPRSVVAGSGLGKALFGRM